MLEAKETRYLYHRNRGAMWEDCNKEENQISAGGMFKQKEAQGMLPEPPASNVKEEDPEYVSFKLRTSTFRVQRAKCGRRLDELKDCLPKAKAAQKNELENKLATIIGALEKFLDDMRKEQATYDMLNATDLEEYHKSELEKYISDVNAHLENGAKFLKGCKKQL